MTVQVTDVKVKPIGSNMTEVSSLTDGLIYSFLYSYQTPVAGWDHRGAFRTAQKYSATTTKQINKYLGGKEIGREVPQTYVDFALRTLQSS